MSEAADRIGSGVTRRAACVAAVLALLAAGAAQAALYKWPDARGAVHYTDKLPPEAVNRQSYELNRQAQPIHKTEPARPVVARAAKTETEEQKQREADRERLLAARRDRALVESYANEAEIDLAKARALATIDGQVASAEGLILQMTRRRQDLESQQATYAPRPVPGALKREMETIDGELVRQHEYITAKKKESAAIAARYDADKLRFRELRAPRPSGSIVTSDDGRHASRQPVGIELTSAR
jgi:hypothetical protein